MGQPVRTLDKTIRFVATCEHDISLHQACPTCQTMAAAAVRMMAPADRHACDNCEKVWPLDQLNEVKDFHQRVAPGEPCPSGECPDCGAVCHLI